MELFHTYVKKIEKNKSHYLEIYVEKVQLLLKCKEIIISVEKGSDFLYWEGLQREASGVLAMLYF